MTRLTAGDILAAAAIVETRANQLGATHLRALADRLTAAIPTPATVDQGNDDEPEPEAEP